MITLPSHFKVDDPESTIGYDANFGRRITHHDSLSSARHEDFVQSSTLEEIKSSRYAAQYRLTSINFLSGLEMSEFIQTNYIQFNRICENKIIHRIRFLKRGKKKFKPPPVRFEPLDQHPNAINNNYSTED